MTLEDALGLLRLPRQLGEHPDGGKVQAGLGRFGPYVVHDKGKGEKDYRSLKGDDDVLAIGLSRALELLAEPKRGRGGRTALKDLGTPEGAEEAIQLFNGPYGLYVKQGKVNASLPEGTTADTITLEQAVQLLAAKAASGKGSGRARAGAGSTAPKASAAKAKTTKPASKASGNAKPAKPAAKPPTTTKTGRLRASAVRVIKPAGS
jgi:DNA topoisomerase-1